MTHDLRRIWIPCSDSRRFIITLWTMSCPFWKAEREKKLQEELNRPKEPSFLVSWHFSSCIIKSVSSTELCFACFRHRPLYFSWNVNFTKAASKSSIMKWPWLGKRAESSLTTILNSILKNRFLRSFVENIRNTPGPKKTKKAIDLMFCQKAWRNKSNWIRNSQRGLRVSILKMMNEWINYNKI